MDKGISKDMGTVLKLQQFSIGQNLNKRLFKKREIPAT